jgi:predicted class III extradiol MEMO1 family dioxygenase
MAARKRALPHGWYPASADECSRDIADFLRGFNPPLGSWLGGVAPHAGWYFSGRAAARVISTLAGSAERDRVVIYGGHLPGHSDPVIYTEEAWDTPMGPQSIDQELSEELASRGEALRATPRFTDNTVEVLLPFGAAAVKWVKEDNDKALIDKALALDAQGLLDDAMLRHNTCSAGPIASVMTSVSRRGAKQGNLIEYYTSYDIMPNSSFVGYAGIVF